MKEWEIGITDNPPSKWERAQPLWADEKIVATNKDSFLDLMKKLCETAIAHRREYAGDSSIDAHLWKLTIKSYKETVNPTPAWMKRMDRARRRDYDESSSDDDSEDGYRGTTVIQCPHDERHNARDMIEQEEDDPFVLPSRYKLDDNVFPTCSIMKVTYDYGTTTTLYLKVLSVKHTAVRSLLQYFSLEAKASDHIKKLKSVPAYHLPKEQQIDHFYPNFSRAFLGHYVPLFQSKSKGGSHQEDYNVNTSKKAIGSASMGLSSRIRRDDDTTFCTMENRTCSSDLLFFPGRFEINELLQTGEKAWAPVDPKKDKNGLADIRYESICRWGVAPGDDEAYARIEKMREKMGPWGPKMLLFQLRKQRKKSSDFHFEKVFPKTYEMLQSGKFRWFQYKKGILRVLMGRGDDNRSFTSDQILDSWKRDFESFHELLCAVEASWVYKGRPMTMDVFVPKFDADLGPSKPLPKEAEIVATKEDAVIVSRCQDKKKLVTALAMSEDHNGNQILYSGHDDGTLVKWNLKDNTQVWSKQIYPNQLDDWGGRYFLHIRDTPGVAGLVVRPDLDRDRHNLYTWTNGEDYRKPHSLKVWSSTDGSFVREYVVDIGNDDKGNRATPDISTIVFCRLLIDNTFVDSILVGLHCLCSVLNFDECYNNFNLNYAEENSEGNILPFYEHCDDSSAMDSWRGHQGILRAMAVVRNKFLLSYSIVPGHGLPDAMILWDLHDPGIPLYRLQLWDNSKRMFKESRTRLREVCGISVCGYDVLFADESGRRVATVKVDKDEETISLEGYAQTGPIGDGGGQAFHGRMAYSNSYTAVANEGDTSVWIYKTRRNSEHPKLDRQDGNARDFERYDEQSGPERWTGREIAVAQVELPKFGGNAPSSSKRQKLDENFFVDSTMDWRALLNDDDRDGGFGNGGAIALAMRGRNLVAGFSNGTIVNTTLPQRLEITSTYDFSANHQASCSALPSDEWHCPMLECDESDVEDSEEDPSEGEYY